MVTPNPFDQMHSRSMNVGSSALSSTSNTTSGLYLTVGSAPYVDFFYTVCFQFFSSYCSLLCCLVHASPIDHNRLEHLACPSPVITRGVQNLIKMPDIIFLKTELTSKFKNQKLSFHSSVFKIRHSCSNSHFPTSLSDITNHVIMDFAARQTY